MAFKTDDQVLDELVQSPSQFFPVMTRATGSRLRALMRPSPYPEVERRRWLALGSFAVVIAVFIYSGFAN